MINENKLDSNAVAPSENDRFDFIRYQRKNKLDSNAVAPSENDRFDFIRYQRSDAELDSLYGSQGASAPVVSEALMY